MSRRDQTLQQHTMHADSFFLQTLHGCLHHSANETRASGSEPRSMSETSDAHWRTVLMLKHRLEGRRAA